MNAIVILVSHKNSPTALWPLFHYLTWSKASDGREEKVNWEDYVAVNTQFAQCIAAHYRQGDKSAYIGRKKKYDLTDHMFLLFTSTNLPAFHHVSLDSRLSLAISARTAASPHSRGSHRPFLSRSLSKLGTLPLFVK